MLHQNLCPTLCFLVVIQAIACSPDTYDYWASLDMDAGADGDTDSDSDTDTDSDSDSDTDSDSDSDTDSETDDGGSCTDTGSGTGTGTDTGVDAGSGDGGDPLLDAGCPPDMVFVSSASVPGVYQSYCIDKYEASRDDATSTSQGIATSIAHSVPGKQPWWNNPINTTHVGTFQAACAAAGKRLCQSEEWFEACSGESDFVYVFGDAFDQNLCNSVGALCDEWCLSHSIPMGSCDLSYNCGYTYGCYVILPTGDFPQCTNTLGTFDMGGNVWEIALTSTSWEIRGGAFNCAGPDSRLQCGYIAGWTSLYAGFRCCKDPE